MENLWTYPLCTAPGAALDWEALNALDWVQNLQGTPQSPVHHAEGDVWIHTRMVMEALLDLPGYQALSAHKRSILFLATLAHDIAKPICTQIEPNGNITSPRHAVKGRSLIRQEIFQENPGPIPFAAREEIAQLVRYHGLPLWFLEKQDLQATMLKASISCDLQMLALLAEADVIGRICHDKQDLLDRVDLFREYCAEQGVWDGPWTFKNGHQRFDYFRHPENGPLYEPFDDFKGEAILMCGLPGSGKDTWISKNAKGLPVISLDQMREDMDIAHREAQGKLINAAKERAKEYLRKGQSFVWNATNILPSIRAQLIELFDSYKARTKIVYIEVPFSKMMAQNAGRDAKVPDNIMRQMVRKWEVPEVWEAVDVEYVV